MRDIARKQCWRRWRLSAGSCLGLEWRRCGPGKGLNQGLEGGATALLGEWSQDIRRRHSWHGGGHLSTSEVEPWHFSSERRQVSLSSLPTPER